jgi:hypothetical protein
MAFFRASLAWLAALTLTFQLGVTLAAATAACCKPQGAMAAAKSEMPCCKEGGGPGHVCPLPAKKPLPVGSPVMQSCCDIEQQVLAALLGFAGIPEASSTAVAVPELVLNVLPLSEQPIALVRPPDSPPPRA